MRANSGIPRDLEQEASQLKKKAAFGKKGDVMVQAWKEKRLVP
jgi:hypothetical protein